MAADPLKSFSLIVRDPEQTLDLARAALAVAQAEYPDLDTEAYVAMLDGLARAVERHCTGASDLYRRLAAMNYVLFQQEGFRGNRSDYYDPRNSYLNEVLERKTGIPITLSVLYMEIAKRVGLTLHGVGFPGHFLVKFVAEEGEIVLDPFNRGEVRSRRELEDLLAGIHRGPVRWRPEFLSAVSKRQILKRMLNNLKGIYLHRGDLRRGLSVAERLVILEPDSSEELRDRGLLYSRLDCLSQALGDLEAYLVRAGDAEDVEIIREQVISLRKRVTQVH
ncbi:MAG: hypothetical protein A3G40_10690 [Deltaproteobacteria bacterium RIFCSPLOWO2_12_FULL_57_22]|nr:MAG: hypothetical protein A3G40_10690 [Deltaproteobacteria bacterium RIFCSPLOWO2_12_FULL_57_22]